MRLPSFNLQTASFDLGRFGRAPIELHLGETPVELHTSFLLAAVVLTFHFWGQLTLSNLALAVAGIAVILASVLMHELAHVAVARSCDIRVARIDIHAFGGVVQFGSRPIRLSRDLALLLAGTGSNLALALISGSLLLSWLEPHMVKSGCEWIEDGYHAVGFAGKMLAFAMFINLGLALINLLPLRPLDGGWITYRGLRQRVGRQNAGVIVALRVTAQGMMAVSLLIALKAIGIPD